MTKTAEEKLIAAYNRGYNETLEKLQKQASVEEVVKKIVDAVSRTGEKIAPKGFDRIMHANYLNNRRKLTPDLYKALSTKEKLISRIKEVSDPVIGRAEQRVGTFLSNHPKASLGIAGGTAGTAAVGIPTALLAGGSEKQSSAKDVVELIKKYISNAGKSVRRAGRHLESDSLLRKLDEINHFKNPNKLSVGKVLRDLESGAGKALSATGKTIEKHPLASLGTAGGVAVGVPTAAAILKKESACCSKKAKKLRKSAKICRGC